MGREFRVREAEERDTDQILSLMRASLGEGSIPRDRSYWNWKHRQNPFGASPVLIAEADDRVVGLRVFMRWTWASNGREIHAVRAVDTATHPEWQGRGMFTRLTMALVERMTAEGVSFVFNTPNDRSRPGYLKMGWSAVGRVSLLVRPRRPLRMLASFRKAGSQDESSATEDEAGPEGPPLAEVLGEPRLDGLLRATSPPDGRLSTLRRAGYLRWRYADIPGLRYHGAAMWDDGGAAVIYRLLRRRGMVELRICECIVGSDAACQRSARPLLRTVLKQTKADYAVAMAAPGTPARRALLRAGFLPAPRSGPILTVRPLATDPAPLDRSAWNLTIGDLELF